MPVIPFTPPHVSVNRVRIMDLPGYTLEADVRGQAAYNLLSRDTVVRYALEQAQALRLPSFLLEDSPAAYREIPMAVDRALSSPDFVTRAAAEHIAVRLGRNLAHILLTLHRGDACNRVVRSDWTSADWEKWSFIQKVWLGGGVLSGDLGGYLVTHAAALLAEWGYADVLSVQRTRYSGEMSLLGAGRYAPEAAQKVLCFDFGQTMVKRAWLNLEGGAITRLEILPSLPTDWLFRNDPTAALRYSGEEVLAFVADMLTRTAVETEFVDGDMLLSMAAYVEGGRLLGNGIYARMSMLGDDVRPLLEKAVHERCGLVCRISLIHDGTAAAALHAGEPRAAVIIVGTALGVGFCPTDVSALRTYQLTPASPLGSQVKMR